MNRHSSRGTGSNIYVNLPDLQAARAKSASSNRKMPITTTHSPKFPRPWAPARPGILENRERKASTACTSRFRPAPTKVPRFEFTRCRTDLCKSEASEFEV